MAPLPNSLVKGTLAQPSASAKPSGRPLPRALGFAHMNQLIALIFAIILLSDATACSCLTRTTLREQVEFADHIFVGRVLSKENVALHKEPKGWPGIAARFQLLEVLKANSPLPTKIITGIGSGDCGVPIFLGLSYVFFAGPKGEIDICNGTRPYIQDNKDMEQYLMEVRSLRVQKTLPNRKLGIPKISH